MRTAPALAAAIAIGLVAGALCALWVTLAEAQGFDVPGFARPAGGAVARAEAQRSRTAGAPARHSPAPTAAP